MSPTERLVFRRIAWRLLPFLVVCQMFAFLDRGNVGFAALTMRADLNLSATAYGLGAGIFFIGYFLCEVPSNLMLLRFGPRRWIARIMITWGLISAATALAWDAWSFLTLRFLLGLAEGGFYPGILYFLSQWFPQAWRARMVSFLLVAIPMSNVVGAPLSGLLLGLDGLGGLHGWQWLFIIEGLPCCVLGLVVLSRLPASVEDAPWLTQDEKRTARAALDVDAAERRKVSRATFGEMLRHGRVWTLALVFFCVSMTNGTVNFWVPQIIKSAGFDNLTVGVLTAIPYSVGVVALVVWGWHSDLRNERRWHVVIPLLVAAAGITTTALSDAITMQIAGLTLAGLGMFSVLAILWTLPGEFLVGTAAAGGIAVINSIGNLGGFAGPFVVGLLKDITGSFAGGLLIDAAVLLVAAGVVLGLTRTASAPDAGYGPSLSAKHE
jgi:ACS family tartrate transporter-like MFS transporter